MDPGGRPWGLLETKGAAVNVLLAGADALMRQWNKLGGGVSSTHTCAPGGRCRPA